MKRVICTLLTIILVFSSIPITNSFATNSGGLEFTIIREEEAWVTGYTGNSTVVEIPETYENLPVVYIQGNVFKNNSNIEKVIIPDSVTEIGYNAFSYCTNLEEVQMSNNIETIGGSAFLHTSLKSITLPKSILSIGDYAFGHYEDMKTGDYFVDSDFVINGYTYSDAEQYALDYNITFVSLGEAPIWIYQVEEVWGDREPEDAVIIKYRGNAKNVTVPETLDGYNIVSLGNRVFDGNYNIEEVTIPNSITYIGSNCFEYCRNLKTVNLECEYVGIMDEAFEGCENLATFNLKMQNPDEFLCTLGANALSGTAYYNNNFVNNALYFFKTLVKVNPSVETFTIPSYIHNISEAAFEGCTNLQYIKIPKSVSEVGHNAFRGCIALKKVEFEDVGENKYHDWHLGDYTFADCYSLTYIVLPELVFFSRNTFGYDYVYDVENGYWDYVKNNNFVIYGVNGSQVEEQANYFGITFKEYVPSGQKHTHVYKTTTTKATLKGDGKIVNKCSCGNVKSTTKIYYPKTIKLSTTTYTYNGKTKKPTVKVTGSNGKTISSSNYTVSYAGDRKYPGKYKVTVKFKGNYEGTKTLYFKIKPKKASLSSVKSTAKKKMTVKWSKQSGVSGYQVVYATNSKFTKGKKTVTVKGSSSKSKTIKSLKSKKTYYVKVRAYKTIDGKKVYGSYSKYKKVKVK